MRHTECKREPTSLRLSHMQGQGESENLGNGRAVVHWHPSMASNAYAIPLANTQSNGRTFFNLMFVLLHQIPPRKTSHKTMDHVRHEMFHTSHRWLRSLHHTIWDCILWGLKIKEEGLWVNYWAKLNTDECLATHPVSTVQLKKGRIMSMRPTYHEAPEVPQNFKWLH